MGKTVEESRYLLNRDTEANGSLRCKQELLSRYKVHNLLPNLQCSWHCPFAFWGRPLGLCLVPVVNADKQSIR